MHIHERRRHREREPAHSKKIDKMKAPRPSLLVLLRFLAILAAAFFIILAVHVEPAQGATYYALATLLNSRINPEKSWS